MQKNEIHRQVEVIVSNLKDSIKRYGRSSSSLQIKFHENILIIQNKYSINWPGFYLFILLFLLLYFYFFYEEFFAAVWYNLHDA